MSNRALICAIAATACTLLAPLAKADFCGVKGQSPSEIQANAIKSGNFKPTSANSLYVAFLNRKTLTTLTFTRPSNKAHPAVACRKAVLRGGAWNVVTNIRCAASKKDCGAMVREFNALDAQMKRELGKAKSKP
jgi:N-acetylglutamate synthase/N-acetylornithine aminotransferase